MDILKLFHGPNAGYLLEQYDRYIEDPASVSAELRDLFAAWRPDEPIEVDLAPLLDTYLIAEQPSVASDDTIAAVARLASAIRQFGYLDAQLDPLGTPPPGAPSVRLETHGLSETSLRQLPGQIVRGPIGAAAPSAWDAIQQLRAIYCHHTGFDFYHITEPAERAWLREAVESRRYHPSVAPIDGPALLRRLTQVEGFEQFLHQTFVGKKRFSIEGLDMMVPMLDEMVAGAVARDIDNVLIGMAHRGRLNVLAHVLEKPYRAILAEFKDPLHERPDVYDGWTGDVKYHMGARRKVNDTSNVTVSIAANPSHLELVNPIVAGMARAAGSLANQAGEARLLRQEILPILIHGDAAFAGQGVVAETLNFSRLPGWRIGGTIHIIANNQIGFTTDQDETRSTAYASDLAKGFKIPVVHVNADDPEACIESVRLALDFMKKFEKDFVIDLVGYRRYGHNEGDEPRFTQPLMYDTIDAMPTVRAKWADALLARGAVEADDAETLWQAQFDALQAIYDTLQPHADFPHPELSDPPPGAARNVPTGMPLVQLRALNDALLALPEGFELHKSLQRVMDRRKAAFKNPDRSAIDWGQAEALAFASILADGTPIRITGEDVERGTFSHRHAVLYNQKNGHRYIPAQHLPQARAAFECRNSALTENAAVGFEYGYSLQAPDRLVLWEAQFGDFINGAQPVIDEYVTSGRAKFEHTVSLVLLLPHGYEGQGPDHSSARLERWLQACAETNLRVVYPTTAAQYFHLLRRQARLLAIDPLPLIVMSPKSLLRHPLARSSGHELADGQWQPVLDDYSVTDPAQIRRLVLCSGKVFVDMATSDHRPNEPHVAVARIEQLYRFPEENVAAVIDKYPALEEIVWLQEEPRNQGAWHHVAPYLTQIIDGRWPLRYLGRPPRASAAEGSATWHKVNQDELMRQAYAPVEATGEATVAGEVAYGG